MLSLFCKPKRFILLSIFILSFVNIALSQTVDDFKFNDADGWFVKCNPKEDDLFNLSLENITNEDLKKNITNYSIKWGDGTSVEVKNGDFPLKHKYAFGRFDLKIDITHNGNMFSSLYYVLNGPPSCNVEIISNEAFSCEGTPLEMIIKIIDFADNPPNTKFTWTFSDTTEVVTWTMDDLVTNDGTMSHTYSDPTCIAGVSKPYDMIVTPITKCGSTRNKGLGQGAIGIYIDRYVKADISFTEPNYLNKQLKDTLVGCLKEVYKITDNSDYGSEDDCYISEDFEWEVFELLDTKKWISADTSDYKFSSSPKGVFFNKKGCFKVKFKLRNRCNNEGEFGSDFTGIMKIFDVDLQGVDTYTPDRFCLSTDVVVEFTNTDPIYPGDFEIKYSWKVDGGFHEYVDGTNSVSRNPHFKFSKAGVYDVQLIKKDFCKKSDPFHFPVYVSDIPVAQILNATEGADYCGEFIYSPNSNITDNVFDPDELAKGDVITSYKWIFTQKGVSHEFTEKTPPDFTFNKVGPAAISLVVANFCGESEEQIVNFNIRAIPDVKIGIPSDICQDASFTYIAMPDKMASYLWTFSDVLTSSKQSGDLSYTSSGDKNINLTVVSEFGCTNTAKLEINVKPKLVLSAGKGSAICNTENTLTISDASIENETRFYWTQGENTTALFENILSPTFTISEDEKLAGEIKLILHGQGLASCTPMTSEIIIAITKSPIINFATTSDKLCQAESYQFVGNVITDAKNKQWTVSPEGGVFNTTDNENPSFTPADDFTGKLIISVKAIGNGTCHEANKNFELNVLPTPSLSIGNVVASICEGEDITLSGSAGNINSTTWTSKSNSGMFSDTNSLDCIYTPSPADIKNGSVEFTLTAIAESPCNTLTVLHTVIIMGKPTASLDSKSKICTNNIIFDLSNLNPVATNYSAVKWEVISGGGYIENADKLEAQYIPENPVDGEFVEIEFTVLAKNPCSASYVQSSKIKFIGSPEITFAGNDKECQGEIYNLEAVVDNNKAILWSVEGDEGSFGDLSAIKTTYTPPDGKVGDIIITLKSVAFYPCVDKSESFTITYLPLPVATTLTEAEVCEGNDFIITDTYASTQNSSSVKWTTKGSGTFSDTEKLSSTYSPSDQDVLAGQVILTLTVHGEAKCSGKNDASEIALTINKRPIVKEGDSGTICQGDIYQLKGATAENEARLKWTSTCEGQFDDEAKLNPIFTPGPTVIGLFTLTLTAYGKGSCSDESASLELNITESPTTYAGIDYTICEDASYTISTAEASNYSGNVLWQVKNAPLGVLTDETSLTPTYKTAKGETSDVVLVLSATGNGSCSSTVSKSEMILSITPHPKVNAGADGELCSNSIYSMKVGDGLGEISASSYSKIEYKISDPDYGEFLNQEGLNIDFKPGPKAKEDGLVEIVIIAYSKGPCEETASDTMLLSVTSNPEVEAGDNLSICEGELVNITTSWAKNYSKIKWSSPDGGSFNNTATEQVVYTPEQGKTGLISLKLEADGNASCESVFDNIEIEIIPIPILEAGDDMTICVGKTVALNQVTASFENSITWSTSGNGSFSDTKILNPIYTPSSDDYHSKSVVLSVIITGNLPCTVTKEDEITLSFISQPVIYPGSDDEICENTDFYQIQEKSATNTTGAYVENISSFVWTTNGKGSIEGENTLSPKYIPAPGEVGIIKLTLGAVGNSNCDSNDVSMNLNIIASPISDFSWGLSCVGKEINFEDKSSALPSHIISWEWNFSDTNVSTDQNPIYLFNTIGEKEIKLTTTNNKGCKSSVTKTVNIYSLPEVSFKVNGVFAVNIPSSFENTSINAISYLWNFGDNTTSSDKDPTHTFLAEQLFDISLIATSEYSCVDSISKTIEAIKPPVAKFTKSDDGCGPLDVEFKNSSEGKYLTYLWDFGNGTSSTLKNPEPIIYKQGLVSDTTYTVSLRIENIAGTSEHSEIITVFPSPMPLFEILPVQYGCSPFHAQVFNRSQGSIDSFIFDFGDGKPFDYTPAKVERPIDHIFTTGTEKTVYTVSLTCTNTCGERTISKDVTVYPNTAVAVMEADTDRGCLPLKVTFSNYSTGAGDYLYSDWIFEDNMSAIRQGNTNTISHVFEKPGIYNVKLIVHDSCAFSTSYRKIEVFDSGDFHFDITTNLLCENETISAELSHDIKFKFTDFKWDMGDGTTYSNTEKVNHIYSDEGNYTITLRGVSYEFSCERISKKNISIQKKPSACFTTPASEGCEPFSVLFTNTSENADFYTWDLDNDDYTNTKNTKRIFNKGKYNVKLFVETKYGCKDTCSSQLWAQAKPIIKFDINKNISCDIPFELKVSNKSVDINENTYSWDFGNNTVSNKIHPYDVSYSSKGSYNITLKATNKYLCSDISNQELVVYQKPKPGFVILKGNICEGDMINIVDTSKYGKFYYWTLGDGHTSQGKDVIYQFDEYGQYSVKLKVLGEGNCADSIYVDKALNIYPKPIVDFDWENDNTPEEINFIDSNTRTANGKIQFSSLAEAGNGEDWIINKAMSFYWDFNDLDYIQEKNPLHKYRNNGPFHVQHIATSAYGCIDSITKQVDVDFMGNVFVPNALNPGNPDPLVAVFLPKGIGLHKYTCQIYDTWGNVVWESSRIENGRPAEAWTGSYKGKKASQGVYIWKISAQFKNGSVWHGIKRGNKYFKEGSVILIR